LGERVGGEAVGAVEPGAGALPDRVETRQRGAPVEVAYDAAHHVMGSRSHRHRLALGIQARRAAGGEYVREPLGGNRAEVEVDLAGVIGLDAIEDRRRNLVARSELAGAPPASRAEPRCTP